jgi:hypothetical protein
MRMHRRTVSRIVLPAVLAMAAFAAPAFALEARLMEIRVAGGSIRASVEIKDMFPAKFQSLLEDGGTMHLRLQLDLWEDRAVWDKLVQPSLITVFRVVLDPATRQVRVADQYGEVSRQTAWQEPLIVRLDLGRAEPLADAKQYYARTLATFGTIAEKETAQASRAVFGDDDGSVSLAAMGKILFHAVVQVNDYLQSVASDSRTRGISGREIRAGVKLQ